MLHLSKPRFSYLCYFFLLFFILGISGCASNHVWFNPGKDDLARSTDIFECEKQAAQYSLDLGKPGDKKIVEDRMKECMKVLGYKWVPEGSAPLVVTEREKPASAGMPGVGLTEEMKGRQITLASNCGREITVAATGNLYKNPGSDETCVSNSGCSNPNTYCLNKKCVYVPIPVTKDDIIDNENNECSKNSDCSGSNQFCYQTVKDNGRCATVPPPDRTNFWQLSSSKSQTIDVPSPWAGRFWPRTGCKMQSSKCPEIWGITDGDCGDHGRKLTKESHYTKNCRSNTNCDSKEKCDLDAVPGYLAPPPKEDECQKDSDCEGKQENMTCITRKDVGPKPIKQCGFYKCLSYKCSDSNDCDPQNFVCDTGQCLGRDDYTFAKSCAYSGLDGPTLAELYMPLRDTSKDKNDLNASLDYYDVSMVDGGNVPVQIAPDPNSYDLTKGDAYSSKTCTKDSDCLTKNKDDIENKSWVCSKDKGSSQGTCVNRFACGSPGCVSDCSQYGYGFTPKSNWGNADYAMPESKCPAELKLKKGGAYVGCLQPKDACAAERKNEPGYNSLNCNVNMALYKCDEKTHPSCYSSKSKDCCGCPGWSLGEQCYGTNKTWENDVRDPYYQKFHDVSPVAYTFPFDDKGATFTCLGKSDNTQVNYTITFCPKK